MMIEKLNRVCCQRSVVCLFSMVLKSIWSLLVVTFIHNFYDFMRNDGHGQLQKAWYKTGKTFCHSKKVFLPEND